MVQGAVPHRRGPQYTPSPAALTKTVHFNLQAQETQGIVNGSEAGLRALHMVTAAQVSSCLAHKRCCLSTHPVRGGCVAAAAAFHTRDLLGLHGAVQH